MIIIEDNFKKHFMKNTYIALGSFDGLHLGHINLINKTVKLARNNNANRYSRAELELNARRSKHRV